MSNLLNDEELQMVSGGTKKIQYMKVACRKCKSVFKADMSKENVKCPKCGEINTFVG